MSSVGTIQGAVVLHRFPGLLGTLGLGRRNLRFLVLDHAVLLVYASESDWADHQEPLDDVVLSAESVVETIRERGE
ncbi:unnamed protein product, partial [Ectocarpus sp. 12 AP-2014]